MFTATPLKKCLRVRANFLHVKKKEKEKGKKKKKRKEKKEKEKGKKKKMKKGKKEKKVNLDVIKCYITKKLSITW